MEQRTDTATLPRSAVAMATYNGEAYLKEQVDSILSQTCSDFELQISDDASTDGTLAILEAYSAKDPRVHVHVNEKNIGYRANFYKAISMCSADLIFLSDQDDRWLPHKMETLLRKIGDKMLVFSDSAITDSSGNNTGKKL